MFRALVAAMLLVAFTPAYAYLRGSASGTLGGPPLYRSDAAEIRFLVNDQTAAGMRNAEGRLIITPDSDPMAALRAALRAWSDLPSSTVHFAPLETTPLAHQPRDGNHVFVFLDSPEIRSVVGSALAVTRFEYFLSGEIVDTDILFNPDISGSGGLTGFSTTRGGLGAIDLQAVATHELGHALGAGHSGVIGAAMFPFTAPGKQFQRKLSDDDVAFLTEAYPAPGASSLFGTITGMISTAAGPATGVLVSAVDPRTGVVVSTITGLEDGAYRLSHVPPGEYFVSAESLDGPVFPIDIQSINISRFNIGVLPRFAGGNAFPTRIRSQVGRENVADINLETGAPVLNIERIGVAPPESAGAPSPIGSGPVLLVAGEPADLVLVGPGLDRTIAPEDIRLLGPGLTVRPESVAEDPQVRAPGGGPILRMTVDVAARAGRDLGTIAVIKGSAVTVYSGALVIDVPNPQFTAGAVVNAASFLGGGVPPGGIISVFGSGLGPPEPGVNSAFDPDTGGLLTRLAAVEVTFDGVPAPLFFVLDRQINLQAPLEISGKATTEMVVTFNGASSDPVTVPVVESRPGIFTVEGGGQAIVLNQDNTLNSASNPARRGEFITIFATGQGVVQPRIASGQPAPADPLSRVAGLTVSLGGQLLPADAVVFAGMSPGSVGLLQVNVRVPGSVAAGAAVPVVLTLRGVASQPNATIAIE